MRVRDQVIESLMLSTFDPVCKCCVVVAYILITGSQWVKCGKDAMFSFSRKV